MRIFMNRLILLFTLLLLVHCNERLPNATQNLPSSDRIDIPAFGLDNTLEIASWNIEQFPMHPRSVEDVREIINDLDIDIFAVEEITDADSFQALVNSLPDYDGRVGVGASNFNLWPGIIFKKSLVTVLGEEFLFTNDSYTFPRAPYSLRLKVQKNNSVFDFTLIILHLKAQGDPESETRRRNAVQALENYITDKLNTPGEDPDYVLAGDWNDQLDDPPADNIFEPFLQKPQFYIFLTAPFAGSPTEYTFIGGSFRSLIDHILITTAIDSTYPGITTRILKIDEDFSAYQNEVSDHRPVAARIPVF